jgi:hypothetical protein
VLELSVRLVFGGVRFAGFSLQNENHQQRLSLSCHGLLMPVC